MDYSGIRLFLLYHKSLNYWSSCRITKVYTCYRPPTKLWEDNVFSHVGLSVSLSMGVGCHHTRPYLLCTRFRPTQTCSTFLLALSPQTLFLYQDMPPSPVMYWLHHYHPCMWVGNVFGHVCLSVCLCICLSVCPSVQTITFEPLDIETSFLVCRYIMTISRSCLSINVIGSRSR